VPEFRHGVLPTFRIWNKTPKRPVSSRNQSRRASGAGKARECLVTSKRNFLVPAIAGLAVGAAVLVCAGGASASNTPWHEATRPARAAQVDMGRMTPLAGLNSYKYTLEVKAGGTEARYMMEDYFDAGQAPAGDRFVMCAQGVVVGPNAQTTVTYGPDREVMWLKGDAFEYKFNSDPIEQWDGPFEQADFDDTSLFAAQQYWDDAVLPWFEANRSSFICSVLPMLLGGEVRDCAYDGVNEEALYELMDAVTYSSIDEFSKVDVRATFLPGHNTPLNLSIVAQGADEMGGSTTFELSMKVSDVNNALLALPPAPSTY
jgi:hypothetical protein